MVYPKKKNEGKGEKEAPRLQLLWAGFVGGKVQVAGAGKSAG
jgi:hypothetical protein